MALRRLVAITPRINAIRQLAARVAPRPDLDFDFLLDDANLELIKQNIGNRKGVGDIDAVREKWKKLHGIMDGKERPKMTEDDLQAEWDQLYELALQIPNMSYEGVPVGSEDNAKIIAEFGEKRDGDFLTAEKLVNPWRTLFQPTDSCGQRSYAFIGALANLERALLDFVLERVMVLGFKPVTVPDLVSTAVTEACGVSQRSQQQIQYVLSNDNSVALSGTAEMGIASLIQNKAFPVEELPLRFVALSRCFRPEISKSASESKLYRVHEFNKVEMFTICMPKDSAAELDYLAGIQKGTFETLGLHGRQLEMPTEELGASAARKIDIEAWMPGRKLYGEISSASNCTDFQARRLGIQYKTKDGMRGFVHTCNGTAIASTRALIALLETFQTDKKGLLDLPPVIRNRLATSRPPVLRCKTAPSIVPAK